MDRSFELYYQYYFAGILVWLFKINDDEYLHELLDF